MEKEGPQVEKLRLERGDAGIVGQKMKDYK